MRGYVRRANSDLLTQTRFSTWMLNTMIISIAATAISLFCGLLAGYALSRLRFPFAGSIETGIFITYLVPQTLLFIPLSNIYVVPIDAPG
jgi:multiple sugar transport system permease protein